MFLIVNGKHVDFIWNFKLIWYTYLLSKNEQYIKELTLT